MLFSHSRLEPVILGFIYVQRSKILLSFPPNILFPQPSSTSITGDTHVIILACCSSGKKRDPTLFSIVLPSVIVFKLSTCFTITQQRCVFCRSHFHKNGLQTLWGWESCTLTLTLVKACRKCVKKTSEERFRTVFSISLVIQRHTILNITQPSRHKRVLREDGWLNGPWCQTMEPYKDEKKSKSFKAITSEATLQLAAAPLPSK